MQPNISQNSVKVQPKCSQNAVKIQSKYSQNSAKMQQEMQFLERLQTEKFSVDQIWIYF